MAFQAFDVDGNPIDGIVPPEEVKTLQQTLEETKSKLEKLENKDFNFRKLEEMTEEQKGKLSATELALKKQAEELEEKQKSFEASFVGDVKNDVLKSLVGDDVELRKKVEANYARIKDSDNAKSREEISALMHDAYVMSVGLKTKNPILSAINSGTGAAPVKSDVKLSDDAKSIASKFGLSAEDLEKYGNK